MSQRSELRGGLGLRARLRYPGVPGGDPPLSLHMCYCTLVSCGRVGWEEEKEGKGKVYS